MPEGFHKTLNGIASNIVLTKGNYGFKTIIEDFENADYINIVTYNITTYGVSELLSHIKDIPINVPVTIVLNIPKKSFGSSDAPQQISWYLKTLERKKFNDLNIFFNFSNHAKLVMTNNKAYIGSQNFSDASSDKIELGIIVESTVDVSRINQNIFETIKSSSIRYATSDYIVTMEEIQILMKGLLEELRENIFTWAGDPPYVPEIETLQIDQAHFPEEEWKRFKALDEEFFYIIDEINHEYETVFDKTKAEILKNELQDYLTNFISDLDGFAEFLSSWDDSVFTRFYEKDNGETDSTMNEVLFEMNDKKDSEYSHLNGDRLLKRFNQIEPTIDKIIELIDEIKYEMLKNTVYENQDIIES
ncbi:hypothetical protein [Anaerobacillus sp. 1_MG-2023]|uniref:hypothetical protein n=1 Tax=Anaerobacillus sp. 1_MG-2023 TaxID=3062655 RepID=UPI0026E1FB7E|nr:hypothetical protein [Anaerobacillus sp. 1_MG-2023]MDO6657390.1 hypothetical protein [Anaerobacillus sp. 1_MG-2023]